MKKSILIGVVLISLVAAFVLTKSKSDLIDIKIADQNNNNLPIVNQDSAIQTDTNTNKEDSSESINITPGQYLSYSKDLVNTASPDSKIVLFFNAAWCPTCQALHKSLSQSLNQIPSNLLILSVDYDTNNDLKKQYGVVVQHTLVEVSATGAEIQKWGGSPDLNDILKRI